MKRGHKTTNDNLVIYLRRGLRESSRSLRLASAAGQMERFLVHQIPIKNSFSTFIDLCNEIILNYILFQFFKGVYSMTSWPLRVN